MNSTESPSRVKEFFQAEVAGADQRTLFPTGPDPNAATYYVRRQRKTMTPADFEVMDGCSEQAIEQGLAKLWSAERPDWVRLAAPVAALAGELRQVEEQEEELSPFIYVMF